MGQARLRRLAAVQTVYHHTSTLRTNLLWMSGVVQVEGNSKGAIHPHLGEIKTDALARRGLQDFPPVAWFTWQIDVPNCLLRAALIVEDQGTGEGQELNETAREAGDDPDNWYVSEVPVDLLKVSEFWHSPSMLKPKLKRVERYVSDIHRMVKMCRETPGAFIPPSWLKHEDAMKLAGSLGLPVANPEGDATGLPCL